MTDFNKLMVAAAFGEYTEGLFLYAAGLAARLNAELIVVSIINERDVAAIQKIMDMGYEVDGTHYVSGIKAERQQILEAIVEKSGFPANRIKTIFRVGNPVATLLKIMLEEAVDMVVMGLKGRTDLEHVLVGSVADKMFHRSPVTVVSYRDPVSARRLKKRIQS
jgi:nucleotide-binding universal stress UspA family protein